MSPGLRSKSKHALIAPLHFRSMQRSDAPRRLGPPTGSCPCVSPSTCAHWRIMPKPLTDLDALHRLFTVGYDDHSCYLYQTKDLQLTAHSEVEHCSNKQIKSASSACISSWAEKFCHFDAVEHKTTKLSNLIQWGPELVHCVPKPGHPTRSACPPLAALCLPVIGLLAQCVGLHAGLRLSGFFF